MSTAPALSRSPGTVVTALSGFALVVLWSSGFVGAELGRVVHAPALTLLTWRYLISTAILVAACAHLRRHVSWQTVRRQAPLGLLLQAGYVAPVYLGVAYGVPGGTASLITSLQPVLVAVAAAAVLHERTTAAQRAGLVVGLLGVTLAVAGDLNGGGAPWWAYLLPAAATLSLGAGTLLGGRAHDGILASLTVQSAATAVCLLVMSAATGQAAPLPDPGFWAAVGWTVALAGFGGYGAYLLVLRTQGATATSAWVYLVPGTTTVWAWLMFGTPIGVVGVAGLLVATLGVGLTLRRPGRGARTRPTAPGGTRPPSPRGAASPWPP
ncbi:DMT family transporter [Myceligenerans cantabricum]